MLPALKLMQWLRDDGLVGSAVVRWLRDDVARSCIGCSRGRARLREDGLAGRAVVRGSAVGHWLRARTFVHAG